MYFFIGPIFVTLAGASLTRNSLARPTSARYQFGARQFDAFFHLASV